MNNRLEKIDVSESLEIVDAYRTTILSGSDYGFTDEKIVKYKKFISKIKGVSLKNIEGKVDALVYQMFNSSYKTILVSAEFDFQRIRKKIGYKIDVYKRIVELIEKRKFNELEENIFKNKDFGISIDKSKEQNHKYQPLKSFIQEYIEELEPTNASFEVNANIKLSIGAIELIELIEALTKTQRLKGYKSKEELYKYICKAFNYDYEIVKNHSTLSSSRVKSKYTDPNSQSRFLQTLMKELKAKYNS